MAHVLIADLPVAGNRFDDKDRLDYRLGVRKDDPATDSKRFMRDLNTIVCLQNVLVLYSVTLR